MVCPTAAAAEESWYSGASQDLLQAVVGAAPDIIYVVDLATDRIKIVGGPIKQLLGYSDAALQTLSANSVLANVYPGDVGMLRHHWVRTIRASDDTVAAVEFRIRRADGIYNWVSCRDKVLARDARGRAVSVLGVATSIQERKNSEQSLRLSHRNLRRTVEAITDCYFTLDPSYRILDVNKACQEWLGCQRSQVVGRNLNEFCKETDECRKLLAVALEQRRPMHAEVRSGVRPDRWLNFRIYPSNQGVVAFFHDVTDRKRAEEAAESSRGLLLAMLDALSAHIAILDEEGTVVGANTAWSRFGERNEYGEPQVVLGDNYLAACRAANSSEPPGSFLAEQIAMLLDGSKNTVSLEYCLNDRWFHIQANRFVSEDSRFVVVAREDVTELALVKQALLRLDEKQRREVSQLMRQSIVSRLSSSIAHELNQPLAAIMSNAEAALDQLEQKRINVDEVREMLQDIVDEDKRAADVISRVRRMIKHDSDSYQLISIRELLESIRALLRNEFVRRRTELGVSLPGELPAIRGDIVELQQVLINMLMNAVEAFDAGHGPEVERKVLLKAETAGDQVRIVVSDNGPGISSTLQNNLFEPFVSTKSGGLGLGLVICSTIAETHGGRMTLENNFDGGASAILTLPVAKQEWS